MSCSSTAPAQQRVGPILRLRSEERVYELLRRCNANRETVNIVEMALTQRRPCMIDVDLTNEQYAKLKVACKKPSAI